MTADRTAARAARASSTVATKNVLQPAAASARATGSTPQPYASALITPAHSAGTAAFSSLRQFATRASRSTVRTPVAVASAAAWLASGDRTVPSPASLESVSLESVSLGWAGFGSAGFGSAGFGSVNFGSETMFMTLRFYAAERTGSRHGTLIWNLNSPDPAIGRLG